MTAKLDDDARRLLDGANFAHLATLLPDGAPKAEPVWVAREDDRILITTDANTLKGKNLARDPRVALSVVAFDNPYEQLLVRGKVVETGPTTISPSSTASHGATPRPLRSAKVEESRRLRHRADDRALLPLAPEARSVELRLAGRSTRRNLMSIMQSIENGVAEVVMHHPPVNALTVGDTWAICDTFRELSPQPRASGGHSHGRGQGLQRGDRHQGDAERRRLRAPARLRRGLLRDFQGHLRDAGAGDRGRERFLHGARDRARRQRRTS